MMPPPPPGQGPLDPRGAFSPPPPPTGAAPPRPTPPGAPPPMMMPPMPPMGFYPPYPPPQKAGFARAIFITLATTIFGLSLAMNIYLLALTGITSGEAAIRSDVLVSGDPSQKVAVISVKGTIDEQTSQQIERVLKEIRADPKIKALVVEVDTPGGGVTASDEIYHRLMRFKKEQGIPIVTAMGGLATSGGYYVACASDEIVAQPTTLTGNIGVVWLRFDLSGTLAKLGAKETSVTPGSAEYKNLESMFKPETPEATAYLRGLVDDMFTRFKDVVSAARQPQIAKAGTTVDKVADGKAYTANEAKKLGLVDQIGYASDAYDRAAALAGLTNKTVVRYEHRPSLFESFAGSSGLGTRSAINLRIDPSVLHDLATPRAMYLWRGE